MRTTSQEGLSIQYAVIGKTLDVKKHDESSARFELTLAAMGPKSECEKQDGQKVVIHRTDERHV